MDKHYTPKALAIRLSEIFEDDSIGSVFDPTMGLGALLVAAEGKLTATPPIIYGTDIDRRTVEAIRGKFPAWKVGNADLFSGRSRAASPIWRHLRESSVDLVTLNPPFSYRGQQRKRIIFGGISYTATPAAAAVAIVLEEIKPSVGVGAIIPVGSFLGDSNQALWESIRESYDVSVCQELPRGSFPEVTATSVLLAIRVRPMNDGSPLEKNGIDESGIRFYPSLSAQCSCIEVVRGTLQIPSLGEWDSEGIPFFHTSDLESKPVNLLRRLPEHLGTSGPLLLIPRVGKFSYSKLRIVQEKRVVLSDCVIGLRAPSGRELPQLRTLLLDPKLEFHEIYQGTGAPYTTIKRVMDILRDAGYSPVKVPLRAGSSGCRCGSRTSTDLMPSERPDFALV